MAKYGVNKVILLGNLGADPEIRYLDQGIAVANLRMATTERFRSANGNSEDRTEWHNVVMWRGLAETAEKYLRKGSTIYVEGKIVNRSWDGPDGQKRYRTEVEADKMIMMDGRNDRPSSDMGAGQSGHNQGGQEYQKPQNPQTPVQNNPANLPEDEDDLPF